MQKVMRVLRVEERLMAGEGPICIGAIRVPPGDEDVMLAFSVTTPDQLPEGTIKTWTLGEGCTLAVHQDDSACLARPALPRLRIVG